MIGLLEREWGSEVIGSITSEMIEAFLTRRTDQERISRATANRYLALLKTMYKKAVLWGYVSHSPAAAVRMAREDQKIPNALPESVLKRLISAMEGVPKVVAVLMLETGLRKSEAFNLLWSDIDLLAGQLTVRRSKSGEFRVVPLSQALVDALKSIRTGTTGHFAVFIRENGTRLRGIDKELREAGKRVGLEKVTHHVLRHTFATRLRERGVALDRIKDLLGHKTMAMTLRYAKATPYQLREAIDALNEPPSSAYRTATG